MIDINSVVLNGTITRDADIQYTDNKKAVANIQITYECFGGEVGRMDATLWGQTAEKLIQYLKKGKHVSIKGELRPRCWERDGITRYKTILDIDRIQLL